VRFLVFQHLEIEHPGVFRDFWRERGVEWSTVELDEGQLIPSDLRLFDALMVMGGPMDVWQTEEYPWLTLEVAAIRYFVMELRRPFLGICLGHQLLAHALGGEVRASRALEVGSCPVRLTEAALRDALFRGVSNPLATFQCHGSEVRRVPHDAVVLAETELCAVQAFRWGRHAYGLQFHAEITKETPSEWQAIPAYEQYINTALGPGASARLVAETKRFLSSYNRTAKLLNDNFLKLVETALARN
jgi:GMP synthase-like glutamine amidotransferase